jgi:hypothetical protein
MSRVVKRSAPQGAKAGPSRRDAPLPQFVPPQLSQPVGLREDKPADQVRRETASRQ